MPKQSAQKRYLADSSALVALIAADDQHHGWIDAHLDSLTWPWLTCDAGLSEAFYLLGSRGGPQLVSLLQRGVLKPAFDLAVELEPVLALMHKYRNLPMSLADACLVRMTEIIPGAVVLTTDSDFRIYRRHGRQIVPHLMP